MEILTLQGTAREPHGTRVARALRKKGELPGIIYGHQEPPEAVSFSLHDLQTALSHGARMLNIDVDGKVRPCLIKEIQYDHLQREPIHLDLARVDLNERVRVNVGVELKGVPKGISEGGILEQHLSEIEVDCLAVDIPETLHPLVTHLTLGQSLLAKDLVVPEGVRVLTDPEERIATVRELAEAPVAAPTPAEGAETPAEPERIGRVRKEEGAEEA